MKDWISVKELAQIQGITPRAVRKSVANNKYISRIVETGTGSKYEIFLPSVTDNIKNCIHIENYRNVNDKNKEPKSRKTNTKRTKGLFET